MEPQQFALHMGIWDMLFVVLSYHDQLKAILVTFPARPALKLDKRKGLYILADMIRFAMAGCVLTSYLRTRVRCQL